MRQLIRPEPPFYDWGLPPPPPPPTPQPPPSKPVVGRTFGAPVQPAFAGSSFIAGPTLLKYSCHFAAARAAREAALVAVLLCPRPSPGMYSVPHWAAYLSALFSRACSNCVTGVTGTTGFRGDSGWGSSGIVPNSVLVSVGPTPARPL